MPGVQFSDRLVLDSELAGLTDAQAYQASGKSQSHDIDGLISRIAHVLGEPVKGKQAPTAADTLL